MRSSQGPRVQLILVDPDREVCKHWEAEFAAWSADVSIEHARFEEIESYDGLVAPGNSFGIMDGGVDAHIVARFPSVHRAVRSAVDDGYLGYQPVGTAIIVPTGDLTHPFLVHAPTMRVPAPLGLESRPNVHDAFWAALVSVDRHNADHPDAAIAELATPGLGTGVGRVPAAIGARLMALAYAAWRNPAASGPRSSFAREASLRQAAGI
jgi:O-acetyl-ADP-ribose deacetylase (regulator of RNase III)